MFDYTDTILSVMQRVEVYNEIFTTVSKEIQQEGYEQIANRKKKDTYVFCRNNVNRLFVEDENFRKILNPYDGRSATQLLCEGLDAYKRGVYYWLDAMDEHCMIVDTVKYGHGINGIQTSFDLINQACREACGGIKSAHSVHKM
ncbi:hypothetical protein IW492_00180 [Enterococcus sp. BWB1-3]|uniref:hypothetical protein n=1 Tax=unclassified Enterococcus TaxID=2608891 RepID=UPI001922B76F|nr:MULTISPECIES: hypothetical protein [unclassified Enterococcus]MBL1227647.1 hypothetical protein [Enterococcus sp. BWB1-3]MCB5954425.1 hypothetical protein [Enterococcus sp. CWB-B31]